MVLMAGGVGAAPEYPRAVLTPQLVFNWSLVAQLHPT
jgi:hypothetical protein